MDKPSLFKMLIYVYDIDVDNCRITHYDWAKEVHTAINDPEKYYDEIHHQYKLLLSMRDDRLTRGNY